MLSFVHMCLCVCKIMVLKQKDTGGKTAEHKIKKKQVHNGNIHIYVCIYIWTHKPYEPVHSVPLHCTRMFSVFHNTTAALFFFLFLNPVLFILICCVLKQHTYIYIYILAMHEHRAVLCALILIIFILLSSLIHDTTCHIYICGMCAYGEYYSFYRFFFLFYISLYIYLYSLTFESCEFPKAFHVTIMIIIVTMMINMKKMAFHGHGHYTDFV